MTKAYALPTEHVVQGSRQYMLAFWCKLKVTEEQQQQLRKNGGIIVAGSLDDDSSDDNDDDNSSSFSDDNDSDVPSNSRGSGRGVGGRGGKKKMSVGRGNKKKGGEKKCSRSGKHNNIKQEARGKSQPGACAGGIVSLLLQVSD